MSGHGESKTIWQEFGPWLRRQREIAGKTRKGVAAAIGIHPVQLARIETGESGTRKETLDALIAELALDPKEAYTRAGFWPPDQSEDAGKADRAEEAARTAEMIQNWMTMSPEEQARALAFLKILKAEHPETLEILGPKFKVITDEEYLAGRGDQEDIRIEKPKSK